MSKLEEYIKNVKEYFEKNPDFTETEKIMYIYLDLGKRFKFDQDFHFAGSKKRKKIYEHSMYHDYMEESFEKNKIICKSCSYICQYILNSIGTRCLVEIDREDLRPYKHVYNIIEPADGSESYEIDLQNDIENIEFHAFPTNFGVSLDNPQNYVIPREEQKRMHEKFGYISKTNPYMDDYLYAFKQYLDFFKTPNEKIDFILQNIDPVELKGINYWERRWKHSKFIDALLPEDEYRNKLYTVEVFKKKDDKKEFYNTFFTLDKNVPNIYIYSEKDFKYNKLSLHDFAKMVANEGYEITPTQGVPKLNAEVRKIKEEEKEENR